MAFQFRPNIRVNAVAIGWVMIATGVIGVIGDAMFIQQINTLIEKLTK